MASVKIDPEGGYPVYDGPVPMCGEKQANDKPQSIPVEQSSADTRSPGDPTAYGHSDK